MKRSITLAILFCLFPVLNLSADDAATGLTDAEKEAGFVSLFNGTDLEGWQGSVDGFSVEEGILVCRKGGGGNLYTQDEYSNFVFRFEFKLESGANNGVGLRTPMGVDAAYHGMEVQILDDSAEGYANLRDYQFHGSIYGVAACERGHQSELGEWNVQEILCDGNHVKVTLNGQVIVDVDIAEVSEGGTVDGRSHPGLEHTTGYIGFLGHGHRIEFRSVRIQVLEDTKE